MVTGGGECVPQHLAHVIVIFDHKDATRGAVAQGRRSTGGFRRLLDPGQPNGESAPTTDAVARRLDFAPE